MTKFVLSKNKEMIKQNEVLNAQNAELKSYIPGLLERIDWMSSENDGKEERISILGEALDQTEKRVQMLE